MSSKMSFTDFPPLFKALYIDEDSFVRSFIHLSVHSSTVAKTAESSKDLGRHRALRQQSGEKVAARCRAERRASWRR